MDDFDVVLEMEFLLEHQVIPMPLAKCLVITRSFPTVVQADIRQPNGFKMISVMQLDKNPVQEEPPSVEIPLGALEKMGETVPKDTLCVPEKYHGVMPKSWPKSLSMRITTDHGIELPPKAKAPAKNAYRTTQPELVVLQKQSNKLLDTEFSRSVQASWGAPVLSLKKKDRRSLGWCIDCRIQNKLTVSRKYQLSIPTNLFNRPCGVKYFSKSDIRPRYCQAEELETTCVTGFRAYEFPMVPFSLIDAKEGKCRSMQRQMNVLRHVVEFHQIEVGKRKIVATCGEIIPKLVVELRSCLGLANSNGQSTKEFLKRASSLTELLEEEDIQWGGNLECQAAFDGLKQATIEGPNLGVAGATKPPKVELLNIAQFGHSTQTDSLIRRIQFEIKGNRHSVLPTLADGPYVEDDPQVHRIEEKWEQMADIARVCLEEASRPMKERVDQKRCPLEFEWMTKLLIKGTTMSCDYLSTWNMRIGRSQGSPY
ncbi:reverse transcriptase [Cucumis melo var. makuwa]|uniref:Reverse transcriptase n=1 Tax=Cucumis melo var. makuwa TaxID=1194695 RepID=A0A5A7UCM0_CUCMM|nr:reverse transcriptase [Cucumis melo var. makuwa]